MGEKKRGGNGRFRRFLKSHSFPDRRFRRLAEDIEAQIGCQVCANCCRVATMKLSERDIGKLARFLRLPAGQLVRDYTVTSEEEGLVLKRGVQCCVFLDGTECTVYEASRRRARGFRTWCVAAETAVARVNASGARLLTVKASEALLAPRGRPETKGPPGFFPQS